MNDGTYEIIGAAMTVHSELGPGLLEIVYQRALSIELRKRAIPHVRERLVPVWYDGENVGNFRADFDCRDEILLELKALPFVGDAGVNQLSHYLAATGRKVGLLLNFGTRSLQVNRVLPRRSKLCGLPPLNSLNSVGIR